MGKKFSYRFDSNTGILYKKYYGIINLLDICSSWDYAIANGLIPMGTKGFILDYREATFDIGISESARIAEYYKKHLDIFGGYKIAIVTTSMKDVVTPTLVAMKDDGYFSRPFFNMKDAIKWVLQ